jgi:hypothetical protein
VLWWTNLLLELNFFCKVATKFFVSASKQQKSDNKIPVFVVPIKVIGCGVLFELATPLTWLLNISYLNGRLCYMTGEDVLSNGM